VALALHLQSQLRDQARRTQSQAFARVRAVLHEISAATPAELLAQAPQAFRDACGFDRAVVSRVPGEAAQVVMMRAEVNAPLVVRGHVVAVVHAERAPDEPSMTRMDRDMAQLLADGLGRAYERAAIAERVADQRARLCQAFSSEQKDRDPIAVSFWAQGEIPVAIACVEVRRDEALSAREQEVLGLLAKGATNLQIAEQLVVSQSTVKWHVKRKLRAANRAEATYLHLRARAG
jgi:DNA-binding CsgD family transcriptional regulator